MALIPSFIFIESFIIKSNNKKELVSTTFTARFADGTEKLLNLKKWCQKGLTRDCDLNGKTLLSKDNCALYYRDWSKNPLLGTWGKNYPSSLIPNEIEELLIECYK
jgi:hypothetical protein